MQLDEGLDTGPMLLERRRPIGPHDTAGDLHDALAELGAAALLEAIDGLAAGTLEARAQPADGRDLRRQDRKVRGAHRLATTSAVQIDRRIRAFNPWPVAETRLGDESLRLLRAACCRSRTATQPRPARVLGLAEDGLRVACGQGVLAVRELQRAGKRPVSARDFANAVRLDGLRLGT